MAAQIDNADRLILDLVQDNSRIGLDILADKCGLSVPSVQRRLKRLRDTGVISKEIALVDPTSLGFGMTFIVMVELERETLHQLDAFRKRAQAELQVQQCYYVTGEADFTLICTARDMQDFEQLTHRLFFNDGNVRRFRTSVVMDRSKVGLSIPCKE
ncbi:Lrp/AsnC family transcriptional regulator [Roseibium sp. SCPC15]|uniref:Lrp/AsnC family transcriptional regulator n=1 Tax=Roseibium sp. SCP15 TaxID=3141376 RepID=UPI00333B410D